MQPSSDHPQIKPPLSLLDTDSSSSINLDQCFPPLINLEISHEMSECCFPKKTPEIVMGRKCHGEDDMMNLNCYQDRKPVESRAVFDGRLEEPNIDENENDVFERGFAKLFETSNAFYSPLRDESNRIPDPPRKESQYLPNVDDNFDEHALPNSPSFPIFTIPRTENYNPGAIDLPGFCQEGVPSDANPIQIPTPKTQQEHIQPRQSPKNTSSQTQERTHSIESNESLSGAPSKKVKVDSHQTSSTACSTAHSPNSPDSLEGAPQTENYNDEVNDGASSHSHPEEEHKQDVNEAALKKKKKTKTSFSPHRSAIKTLANSALRYLSNVRIFRRIIRQKVCKKYKIPMENIKTYLVCHVKGFVTNETELFNAIGNAGPKGINSHILLKEEAKRAVWLLFQILLGERSHFERWVDDPVFGYQPGSKSEKGEKIDKESPEYLAKQEEKRKIYKKEGEREKLRKIFENSELSAQPEKGRKKNKSVGKTKTKKEEKYLSYDDEQSLNEETLEDFER